MAIKGIQRDTLSLPPAATAQAKRPFYDLDDPAIKALVAAHQRGQIQASPEAIAAITPQLSPMASMGGRSERQQFTMGGLDNNQAARVAARQTAAQKQEDTAPVEKEPQKDVATEATKKGAQGAATGGVAGAAIGAGSAVLEGVINARAAAARQARAAAIKGLQTQARAGEMLASGTQGGIQDIIAGIARSVRG